MKWNVFLGALLLPLSSLLAQAPIDGIVEKTTLQDRRVLPYPQLREADILWEKRIWRQIDTRHKINLPFRYPGYSFFEIIRDGILEGALTAYSAENDQFTNPISKNEVQKMLSKVDTATIIDPITYEETIVEVFDDINPEDIVHYRVKEVWFFDTRHSRLGVRILGIAPIQEVRDEFGEVAYRKPMFWIYYPHAREYLAQQQVFNPLNDASVMSWEDHLEMRFFDSHIIKESNVHDRRLEDYLSGTDLLREGQKIEDAIFNYESDLWSW